VTRSGLDGRDVTDHALYEWLLSDHPDARAERDRQRAATYQAERDRAGREADRRSHRGNQAKTRGQVPAPPARPAHLARLQVARGHVPATPDAVCASHDPELWFSPFPQAIAQAKAICHSCAHQLSCLSGAIERRETYGIWGETDFNPRHQEDVA